MYMVSNRSVEMNSARDWFRRPWLGVYLFDCMAHVQFRTEIFILLGRDRQDDFRDGFGESERGVCIEIFTRLNIQKSG